MESWAAPLAVVLAGVLGLAGVWVGKRWEQQSSNKAWWRERRLITYTEVLSRSHVFVTAAKEVTVHKNGELPGDEMVRRLRELSDPRDSLHDSVVMVRLLGPKYRVEFGVQPAG